MGLKSGSRDPGLDESESADDATDSNDGDGDTTTSEPAERDSTTDEAPEPASGSTDSSTAGDERPTMESIPYKLRRNKVNEGRDQVPFFLRDDVIENEGELQDALEAMLGETVYKSDYREAAMIVAQRNPELVAEVLREWGYDLDTV